jgi:hypothetical protein
MTRRAFSTPDSLISQGSPSMPEVIALTAVFVSLWLVTLGSRS